MMQHESWNPDEPDTCVHHAGKVQYASRHAAERSMRHIRRFGDRLEDGKKPTRSYLCGACERWFLTSRPA